MRWTRNDQQTALWKRLLNILTHEFSSAIWNKYPCGVLLMLMSSCPQTQGSVIVTNFKFLNLHSPGIVYCLNQALHILSRWKKKSTYTDLESKTTEKKNWLKWRTDGHRVAGGSVTRCDVETIFQWHRDFDHEEKAACVATALHCLCPDLLTGAPASRSSPTSFSGRPHLPSPFPSWFFPKWPPLHCQSELFHWPQNSLWFPIFSNILIVLHCPCRRPQPSSPPPL